MKTLIHFSVAFFSLVLLGTSSLAYEVGDRVAVINDENGFRVGNTVVHQPALGDVVTVREIDGQWLKADPDTPGWIWERDVIALENAVEHFTARIERDPDNDSLYAARANVFSVQGYHQESLQDWSEAIRLNPSEQAFGGRARAYMRAGNYYGALQDFGRCYEIGGIEAVPLKLRGQAFLGLGEYPLAIQDFNQAIAADATDPDLFYSRGMALLQLEKYADAIADFERSVELDSANSLHLAQLAWLLSTCPEDELRDGQRAVELASRAYELSSVWEYAYDLDTLAAAYAEVGNFDAAIYFAEEALDLVIVEKHEEELLQRLALYERGQPYRIGQVVDDSSSSNVNELPGSDAGRKPVNPIR